MSERLGFSPEESGWKNAAVYQIYPSSFNEVRKHSSEIRGEGSIDGITAKLDYLRYDLGVDAIWISPFYPSPRVDGGYDISDYCDVDERYGSIEDFDRLVQEAHERELKVMIDLVPNHTSTEHPWYKESVLSRDNPKADWYIYRDPAPDGGPPNNWASVFSLPQLRARQEGLIDIPEGELTPPLSSWQYVEARDQYVLCTFAPEQADLNWANPEVREAMKDVMRFWLDRQVDGFRIDVMDTTAKNNTFADEEYNPDYREGIDNPYDQLKKFHSASHPDTLRQYVAEVAAVLDEDKYRDRDTRIIYEAYVPKEIMHLINNTAPHRGSAFNFVLMRADYDASTYRRLIEEEYVALSQTGGIANHVLGNHDQSRVASRLGPAAARTAAVVELTLPGMAFIYQGDEAGFTDVDVPRHRRHDDDLGLRDAVRTPMLWTPDQNAGFSEAHPDMLWLPIDPNYEEVNIQMQHDDPLSYVSLYRSLLRIRKQGAFRKGSFEPLPASNGSVLTYAVRTDNEQAVILANFSAQHTTTEVYQTQQIAGNVVLSSFMDDKREVVHLDAPIELRPNESVIIAH